MQLGNLNLMILKSISESEKYGLEIIDDISKKTNGKTIVKQPSLYSGLRRLEQRGLISSRWEDSDIGGRRHYYAITNLGASELRMHDLTGLYDEQSAEEKESKDEVVETEAPKEVPSENIFEIANKTDEQIAFDLERSFDEPEEQQENLVQQDLSAEKQFTNEQFSAYDPQDNASKPKSFSDNMKEYVEPENNYDEYKLNQEEVKTETDQPTEEPVVEQPAEEQIVENQQATSPQDTVVEYVNESENKDDINYKDILGDLDADLNKIDSAQDGIYEEEIKVQTPIESKAETTEKPAAERTKSAYEKELEDILISSNKDDATRSITLKETDRMAEVNRRYGDGTVSVEADEVVEDETFDENIHKIAPKDVGFTYINQEDITVKPYKQNKKSKANSKTGLFLNVNKYNLIRASIMVLLMALELAVSFAVCSAYGLFEQTGSTAIILYSISAAIVLFYLVITLIYTLSNLSKKIRIDNISFGKEFLYRFIMFAFVILFILGLNIFMGMPNTVSWLIPCIMAANILVSWIVGLIMYHTRNFHA